MPDLGRDDIDGVLDDTEIDPHDVLVDDDDDTPTPREVDLMAGEPVTYRTATTLSRNPRDGDNHDRTPGSVGWPRLMGVVTVAAAAAGVVTVDARLGTVAAALWSLVSLAAVWRVYTLEAKLSRGNQ